MVEVTERRVKELETALLISNSKLLNADVECLFRGQPGIEGFDEWYVHYTRILHNGGNSSIPNPTLEEIE